MPLEAERLKTAVLLASDSEDDSRTTAAIRAAIDLITNEKVTPDQCLNLFEVAQDAAATRRAV